MPIVLENTDTFSLGSAAASGSMTGVMAFTPTVGRKLILGISHFSVSTIVRIQQGDIVWVKLTESVEPSAAGAGARTEIWVGDVVGPVPNTFMFLRFVSDASGDSAAVAIHEVSGLRNVWPVDEQFGGLNDQLTPLSSGSTGIQTVNDSYIFAALGGADSSGTTAPGSPTNGFTQRAQDVGADADTAIGHRITTLDKTLSTPAIESTEQAYSGSQLWAGTIAAFKGDAAPLNPIELVQTKDGIASPGTSVVVTLDAAPQAGNTLILSVVVRSNETVTGVASGGAVWVQDVTKLHGSSTVRVDIWRTQTLGAGVAVTVSLSGSSNVMASVQEFSGVLGVGPLDATATNEGTVDPVTSGSLSDIPQDGMLIFGAIGHNNFASGLENSFGFHRVSGQIGPNAATGTFIINDTFKGSPYQVTIPVTSFAGDWVAAIASYRNTIPIVAPGASVVIYSDEKNQDGGLTQVTATPTDLGIVAAGQFTTGNRHLILGSIRAGNADATNLGPFSNRLNVNGAISDLSDQYPAGSTTNRTNEMYGVCRLLTLDNSDDVRLEGVFIASPVVSEVRQSNLVVLDLDTGNFFEGRDWFYVEDATAKSDLDLVFANNVVTSLRVNADGVSSYLVVAHARLTAVGTTDNIHEAAIQLWDATNSQELSLAGWKKSTASGTRSSPVNITAVITPPAGVITLQVRCVGGTITPPDGWSYEESSIAAIRLDHFVANGFDQDLSLAQSPPGDRLPPSRQAVFPQAAFLYRPDSDKEMLTIAFTQADNSANDEFGIGSHAEFGGLDSPDRSLLDTSNPTLGGVQNSDETVNLRSGGSPNTYPATPTWMVSHRVNVSTFPNTVKWSNAGRQANASTIDRVCIACIGVQTNPVPAQAPPPTPVTPPAVVSPLIEKLAGTHEDEALGNLIEQFKPVV